MKHRLCPCGSGLDRDAQFDGYGIFLCYTCPVCHDRQMARYRPDIAAQYETDDQIEPD